jgi:hypothetical protein
MSTCRAVADAVGNTWTFLVNDGYDARICTQLRYTHLANILVVACLAISVS